MHRRADHSRLISRPALALRARDVSKRTESDIDGRSGSSRAVVSDMCKGGLTAANCTCSICEGFADTMRNIALWKRWFADHADLITPVRVTTDIHRAKAEGKTGIILRTPRR